MSISLNCMIVDDDEASRSLIKQYIEDTGFLKYYCCCADGAEAFKILHEPNTIDLLFLDVEMPKMSGVELLNALDRLPSVIMITSNPDYAVRGFELGVNDYITKPISYSRFLKSSSKVYDLLNAKKKTKEIFIKVGSSLIKLAVSDIKYIEACGDYINIYTVNKKHTVYSTLSKIEHQLPVRDFAKVHRSFIVRIDKILSIDEYSVELDDKCLPVSKSHKKDLMSRIHTL